MTCRTPDKNANLLAMFLGILSEAGFVVAVFGFSFLLCAAIAAV